MTKSSIPFVGLHAHSVAGSPFDALGYPPEHMDYAYENGCDALALTDHGNMNGLAYQVLHAKKMQASGKNFRPRQTRNEPKNWQRSRVWQSKRKVHQREAHATSSIAAAT